MALKLHHVGLVFPSVSEIAEVFRGLGLGEMTDPQPDPIQRVSARFIAAGGGQDVYLELLEPIETGSPVTGFLKRKGGGLHHICFEVDDMEGIADRLTGKGFTMVCGPVECVGYDRSFKRECAQPSKVAFFLLPDKILIEFLQRGI